MNLDLSGSSDIGLHAAPTTGWGLSKSNKHYPHYPPQYRTSTLQKFVCQE